MMVMITMMMMMMILYAYAQSDESLCKSLEYSMIVKLLAEHHLDFLRLKGGCTSSSEYTLVKIPHCWKSHVTAQIYIKYITGQRAWFILMYVICKLPLSTI